MSAPLFFADAISCEGFEDASSLLPGSTLLLGGAEGRHAATVRRVGVNERVDVADGVGLVARCVVLTAAGDSVRLSVLSVEKVPPASPRFVLVQALAKGGRDELAVETATELGVDEVVPWQAARSVVQWRGARGDKARAGWAATARAAAKQCRRPRVPVVSALEAGADVRSRISVAALAVVLHEEASLPLAEVALPSAGDVLVIVGPEGGISPDELALFTGAGALACRLGPWVLRSSSAGPAALAVFSAAARWR